MTDDVLPGAAPPSERVPPHVPPPLPHPDPVGIDRVRRSGVVAVVAGAALAGFVALAAALDVGFADDAGRLWIKAGFFAVLAAPAATVAAFHGRRWARVALAVAVCVVLVLWALPWHPRKRFVRTLRSVEIGMTEDAVAAIFADYLPGPGSKWESAPLVTAVPEGAPRSRATYCRIYRWNDADASYDSDWGLVTFTNGRVSDVEFRGD